MRDISGRLQRHRLRRYAAPEDPMRLRIHWAWWGLLAWLLWVCLLSDHSFYRLWQLRQENVRTRSELDRVTQQVRTLDADLRDPRTQRGRAERALREKSGMARPGEIIYRIQPARDSLDRD
jgi:cell division protein FtsB